jgi:hypothetical protein
MAPNQAKTVYYCDGINSILPQHCEIIGSESETLTVKVKRQHRGMTIRPGPIGHSVISYWNSNANPIHEKENM